MKPMILPRPKRFVGKEGEFAVEAGTAMVLAPDADGDDFLSALSLKKEIASRGGPELPPERHVRLDGLGRRVLLLRLDRDEGLWPPLAELGSEADRSPESYCLLVTPDEVVVAGRDAAGLFYGVQTLRQLLQGKGKKLVVPSCEIADRPDFRYRGVMHDVSRRKVPTLETLFGLVELLSSLKMNVLQLYTEHTFTYRRHPKIGANAGAMSPEDVMRLDEFCRRHHVELQPNLQSFGHFADILSVPEYAHLKETEKPWTLSPVEPGSYDLLGDMYDEFLPCFSSTMFNADCDETWDLGEGKSKDLSGKIGLGRVYLGHIERIRELAQSLGKRLMIWGDIVLKHPELIPEVPKDIVMLNWGYGAGHDFASTRKFADAGLDVMVCPGTNGWVSIFPRVEVACVNIRRFAEEGKACGALGVLNTDWGDDGHANLLGHSFHGFAYGAEQSWSQGEVDEEDFDARFSWAVFRDAKGAMGRAARALGMTNDAFAPLGYGSSPFRLYWEPFPGGERLAQPDERALRACEKYARQAMKLAKACKGKLPGHELTVDEFLLAARQSLYACKKVRAARSPAKKVVKELSTEWDEMRAEFERLWLARSRPSEIRYRLGRYKERARDYKKLLKGRKARKPRRARR